MSVTARHGRSPGTGGTPGARGMRDAVAGAGAFPGTGSDDLDVRIRSTAHALVTTPPPEAPGRVPPGVVVGLEMDGVRVVAAAGRTAPAAGAAPMTRETRHDLASVTKVVATTTAVLHLVDDGALTLATPVRAVLPSYPGDAATTVEDLLRHRAGLWEWQPLYLAPDRQRDPAGLMDALPLRYAPHQDRHYSDLGFLYLGRLVTAVTGSPLGTAVHDLALAPAGLRTATFGPLDPTHVPIASSSWGDRAEQRMVATGVPYPSLWPDRDFRWREGLLTGEVNDGNCAHAWDGTAGHAGLFGTVDDLLDAALDLGRRLREGDPHGLLAPGPDAGQSLGWRVRTVLTQAGPAPLLWHPGFTGCAVGLLPGLGGAVALASNRLLADGPPLATEQLWWRTVHLLHLDLDLGRGPGVSG